MRTTGTLPLDYQKPEEASSLLIRPAKNRQAERFAPAVPQSVSDLGISPSLLEQLIFKFLYCRGDMLAGDLSRALGLKFSVIQAMLETFKLQHLVQVRSSLSVGSISSLLSLTEAGRKLAREHLEYNHYVGPAPVPVNQYTDAVNAQQMPRNWLRPERLAKAYAHMVITEDTLDQIGPAVNSGKSLLIYGQPGNGKTHLAEALSRIQTTEIYVPHALEHQGAIIRLFDPHCHRAIESCDQTSECETDGRWVRCRRPFVVSGGELSVAMLDLSYNAVSKIYDAPLQLKANNGIYLIDDFGRQVASPVEILNRWIVPMDRYVDHLSLSNGGKVTVPFGTFLVFSTNLNPNDLGDEAFLRRIQYKMLVRSPDEYEFTAIFKNFCELNELHPHPRLISNFVEKHYAQTGKPFRRCHPRDVITLAIDYIHYKRLPYELTEELLDRAFENCFLSAANLSDS